MKKNQVQQLLLCILATIQSTSAIDFLFNGFNSSDVSLYGNAAVDSGILTFTNASRNTKTASLALYPQIIPTKQHNTSIVLPFSTSFILSSEGCSMSPGCIFLFLFFPREGTLDSRWEQILTPADNGSFSNRHILGVEFDYYWNSGFNDTSANHVGIDVNSLVSVGSHGLGYWIDNHGNREDGCSNETCFESLKGNYRSSFSKQYQFWLEPFKVWIDYANGVVNVTIAPLGMKRPNRTLLSVPLNLSDVLEDEMYVGFASLDNFIPHRVLGWSFSNTNFTLSEGLASFELPQTPSRRSKGLIGGIAGGILIFAVICCVAAYLFVKRSKRKRRETEDMEDWELEYWPHRLSYKEIESSTKNFAEENIIGIGGNGEVYRGVFRGGSKVAIKRISHENDESLKSFIAEISSLGRVQHRNVVKLRGWCKKDKGSLILVYEYMENGSLDKRVFECDEKMMLSCGERIRILKQVASGILYLHEGWESKVLHRDIKASNVLLDNEMNAKLGDFGLARMHDHDKAGETTRVVGSIGYMAPEILKNGRASTETDVFSYGVLILEVMCGRRPIETGRPALVDWVWQLFQKGKILDVVDARLRDRGDVDEEEVERVVQLGLLCAHPDPKARPTMRQLVKMFEVTENESDEEGMELYLLNKLKSGEIVALYRQIVRPAIAIGAPPALSSSCSALSWSDSFAEGR